MASQRPSAPRADPEISPGPLPYTTSVKKQAPQRYSFHLGGASRRAAVLVALCLACGFHHRWSSPWAFPGEEPEAAEKRQPFEQRSLKRHTRPGRASTSPSSGNSYRNLPGGSDRPFAAQMHWGVTARGGYSPLVQEGQHGQAALPPARQVATPRAPGVRTAQATAAAGLAGFKRRYTDSTATTSTTRLSECKARLRPKLPPYRVSASQKIGRPESPSFGNTPFPAGRFALRCLASPA